MNKLINSPEWVQDAIFYQIFPDRFANGDITNDPPVKAAWGSQPTSNNYFGGDLLGIIQRLDYLQDLGITALYLTPIFKAKSNHKYDTFDYYEIDPSFGNKKIFKALVDDCHRRGIRIILDGVFNHCGYDSILFNDLREKEERSKYLKWFDIRSFPIDKYVVNYQTCGGTWYLPKLNTDHPDVREYLFEVAAYWIREFGIDGWRLDVPWKVSSGFWIEFRQRIKNEFPQIYLVGEIWRDPSIWVKGDRFDGVMNYALRNYILDYCVFDHMDAEDFNHELLLQAEIFGNSAAIQMNLLGSHDTPRFFTLCQENIKRELLAISFLFTYIGAPMIYYGDEIGLVGENDPDCRRCMPWEQKAEWNMVIKNHIEKLIKTRLRHKALRRGTFKMLMTFNGIYAYQRQYEDDVAIVILNPRMAYQDIKIPYKDNEPAGKNKWRDLLSGKVMISDNDFITIDHIDSMTGLILLKEK
jgi:glycosidase